MAMMSMKVSLDKNYTSCLMYQDMVFESIEACYKFNKKFNDILNAFGKKWHPASARKEYETTFAIS